MITHYCQSLEEALKKAKQAGKQPGCEFWGITVSGKKGFAVYKNGMLVERYSTSNHFLNNKSEGVITPCPIHVTVLLR